VQFGEPPQAPLRHEHEGPSADHAGDETHRRATRAAGGRRPSRRSAARWPPARTGPCARARRAAPRS
jgi:hypothetical protein